MGKYDMPEPPVRPPPVTPESDEVKVAGQRRANELKEKKGRLSTMISSPSQTGFAKAFGSSTGGVS